MPLLWYMPSKSVVPSQLWIMLSIGVSRNDPFGSRSEPEIRVCPSNLCQASGEIPKGRADVHR